tara:strand:- start:1995 stop:2231 length:237 start_codon:yes stop_codon:yes gene_type:complete
MSINEYQRVCILAAANRDEAAKFKAEVEKQAAEIAKLEARLRHTHKECEYCTMTCIDTLGDGICKGCGEPVWMKEVDR